MLTCYTKLHMFWVVILATLLGGASSTVSDRRNFRATAFRAARSGSTNQLNLWQWGTGAVPAPAAAPAPPPPPPPEPDPPQFPVIGQDACSLLEEAFVVEPRASCKHVLFASNSDGCTCTMVLPASINPLPGNFYNPFLVDVPPNPDIPVPQAMPTVPPPSNPMQPYLAPPMPPECPFISSCADPDSFDCVGHNSWGFAEAHMADYSPAAGALNTASCTYIMKPYAIFKVPDRVAALWHLNAKLVKVFDRTAKPLTIFCDGKNVTSPSLEYFCRDQLRRLGLPCSMAWTNVTKKHQAQECADAPAPDGFDETSTLAELCPLECGWKKGVARWPPFLTAAEKAVIAKKKKAKAAAKEKEKEEKEESEEEEAKEKEE